MTVWIPMGLGLVVLVTGCAIVVYARGLDAAPPPLERRDRSRGELSKVFGLLESTSGRSSSANSARWCGVGAIVAGVFLVLVSVVSLIGR